MPGLDCNPAQFFRSIHKPEKLKRTPEIGSKISLFFIDDIDNDNYPEIVSSTFTYQNYDSTLRFPYDDNWSRLFIFDHNLQFESKPVQFSNLRSQARVFPFQGKEEKLIYGFIDYRGDTTIQNMHFLMNRKGEIIKQKVFVEGDSFLNLEPSAFRIDNNLYVKDKNGFIYRIDANLGLHKIKQLKEFRNCNVSLIDINSDGEKELLWADQETGKKIITDSQFKHPVEFFIPGDQLVWVSPVTSAIEKGKYHIKNNQGNFIIQYRQNPIWNLRFIIYTLIIISVWLLLALLNRIQSYKIKEKLRLERELQELQYRAITSQFSPHYTFNVLNTFSSQLYHKENPELYNYFNKFIRQLRYLYDDKNAITRSIKEELNFCSDYLDIQKMRFKEKFRYEIFVDKKVDQSVRVPKMIMHTFVENAFKHGIRPYEKGGLISIAIKKERGKILISIIDNGVGRQAAEKYNKENEYYSSGRGVEMLYEFISVYNKSSKYNIKIEFEDLFEESTVAGTKVKILIGS